MISTLTRISLFYNPFTNHGCFPALPLFLCGPIHSTIPFHQPIFAICHDFLNPHSTYADQARVHPVPWSALYFNRSLTGTRLRCMGTCLNGFLHEPHTRRLWSGNSLLFWILATTRCDYLDWFGLKSTVEMKVWKRSNKERMWVIVRVTWRNGEKNRTRWHAKSAWIAKAGTQEAFGLRKAWPVECNVDATSDLDLHVSVSRFLKREKHTQVQARHYCLRVFLIPCEVWQHNH